MIAAILACVTGPTPLCARLYENETQSEQRYGKGVETQSDKSSPLLPGAVHRSYEFHGWRIRIAYLDGKAVMERYMKSSAPGGPSIKEDEFNAILVGETNGGKWEHANGRTLNPIAAMSNLIVQSGTWTNSNGSTAHYGGSSSLSVTLELPAAEEFRRARAKDKELKRVQSIPRF